MNVARHSHTPNIAAAASTWTNLSAKITSSIAGPVQQIGPLPQEFTRKPSTVPQLER
jgi:hypothetical protein